MGKTVSEEGKLTGKEGVRGLSAMNDAKKSKKERNAWTDGFFSSNAPMQTREEAGKDQGKKQSKRTPSLKSISCNLKSGDLERIRQAVWERETTLAALWG